MDHIERSRELAQEFIASRGGTLPSLQYNIRVPGIGSMSCYPENDTVTKYWILSSEINRLCKWHSATCLIGAIEELPDDERALIPLVLSSGEIVKMHAVSQRGLMPLLLNNVGHYELGLSFLACSWSYVFAQKKNDYERIPEPLRTSLRFWDIVEVDDDKRAIDMQTMCDSFNITEEEIRAIIETTMTRVWDNDRGAWIYKKL